jgi:hypothetical protein
MKLKPMPCPGGMKLQSSSKVSRGQFVCKRMWVLSLMTVGLFTLGASAADDNPKSGLDMQRLGKIQQRMQEFVNSGQAAGIVSLFSRMERLSR